MAKSTTTTAKPVRVRMLEPAEIGPTKLKPGRVYTVSAQVQKDLGKKATAADG